MITSLGKLKYKNAIPELETIIQLNKEHDTITDSASLAYVRIIREDLTDIKPIVKLLKVGNLSVLNGVSSALTFDQHSMSRMDSVLVRTANK